MGQKLMIVGLVAEVKEVVGKGNRMAVLRLKKTLRFEGV